MRVTIGDEIGQFWLRVTYTIQSNLPVSCWEMLDPATPSNRIKLHNRLDLGSLAVPSGDPKCVTMEEDMSVAETDEA